VAVVRSRRAVAMETGTCAVLRLDRAASPSDQLTRIVAYAKAVLGA
jgi:hypothetical protein